MYEHYLRLSPNALHTALHKRKLHPREISHIKDAVAQMREALRADKITRTHRRAEWAHLLKPLQYELNSAKVGRAYRAEPNGGTTPPFTDIAARIEVFDAYIAVMEKLLARFALASKELQHTPIQLAKRKNATAKGSHIPNNGEHWTDWIPVHIKEPIHEAFAALPHKPKAKRKVPFQRTVTPIQHAKLKATLLQAALKEHETIERHQAVAPTSSRQTKLNRIKEAIKIIENFKENEHIPATWHTVLDSA